MTVDDPTSILLLSSTPKPTKRSPQLAKRSSYGSLRCHDGRDLIILGGNLAADIGGRGSGLEAIRKRMTPD